MYRIMVYRAPSQPYYLRNGDNVVREFRDWREAKMVADYMQKMGDQSRDPASYGVVAV